MSKSIGCWIAERRYDSIWYLGYDPISERYVLPGNGRWSKKTKTANGLPSLT